HAKTKLRCAECGVFNEIPKEVLEALAAVAPPAAPARPQATSEPDPEPSEELYGFLKEPEPPAPPPVVGEKPAEAPKPKPEKKKPVSDDEAPREVLIHGTEEDDGNPYHVTGDIATRRCLACKKKVDV